MLPSHGRSILIVDLNPITRWIAHVTLEMHGYVPFTVEDGDRALQIATRQHVDLVLLEDATAKTYRWLSDFRALPDYAMVPILVLVRELAWSDTPPAGPFSDYIFKPLAPSELVARVEAHVLSSSSRASHPQRALRPVAVAGEAPLREAARLRLVAAGFHVAPAADGPLRAGHAHLPPRLVEVEASREATPDLVGAVEAFLADRAAAPPRSLRVSVPPRGGLHRGLEQRLALRQAPLGTLDETWGHDSVDLQIATLVPWCLDALGAVHGAVHLADPKGFTLKAQTGFSEAGKDALGAFLADDAVRKRVLNGGETLLVTRTDGTTAEAALLAALRVSSLAILPIRVHGQPLGTFTVASSTTSLSREWADVARGLGEQLGQAILVWRGLTELAVADPRHRQLFEGTRDALRLADRAAAPSAPTSPPRAAPDPRRSGT